MQPDPRPSDPLSELLPLYAEYMRGESRRPGGIKRYHWGMQRFITWYDAQLHRPAILADLIDTKVAQRYKVALGNRGNKESTIINAMAVLHDFGLFAGIPDPTAGVKRPRKRRPNPNPLYEDEIVLLLQAIAMPDGLSEYRRWIWDRNIRMVYLFLYTGLRLSELANLRWKHVRLAAGVIEVRGGKNNKDRLVPIHKVLDTILEAVPLAERGRDMPVIGKRERHQPDGEILVMSDGGLEKVFASWLKQRLQEALQDEAFHVHAHKLRHTFASLLIWAGKDLRTLQELLGHEQLGTTEWYVKVKDDQKRDAIDGLPSF